MYLCFNCPTFNYTPTEYYDLVSWDAFVKILEPPQTEKKEERKGREREGWGKESWVLEIL